MKRRKKESCGEKKEKRSDVIHLAFIKEEKEGNKGDRLLLGKKKEGNEKR